LDCAGKDATAQRRVEAKVHGSVGIEPGNVCAILASYTRETATHKNFTVRLRHNIKNGVIDPGIEVSIACAIRIQARDETARESANREKAAAEQNLSVRLDGYGFHRSDVCAGIERHVHASIRIEPPNIFAELSTQCAKTPANENLSIGLDCETFHFGW
jgi:hypothetical protein